MAKIEVKNIYKIFGANPSKVLDMVKAGASKDEVLEKTGHTVGLRDVSLSMEAGKTFVVMGLSGSGKSTMIRHLNRLIDPTAGEVIVDGQDVMKLSDAELMDFRRHKMSMVFQRFGLFPHKTVMENVAYGLDMQVTTKHERAANREKAAKWVATVGLAGYEASYPHALSGGMQQRVGLARALAADTDILLMDEAFSALDPLIRRDMQDQLIELQETLHKTIVFITHDLDEALRLGDKIAILKDGGLEQVGTGEEILQAPATPYVAEFVEDVNRGRVLTAGTVKKDVVLLKETDSQEDILDALRGQDVKVTYVVNKDGRLVGALTGTKARKMAEGDGEIDWAGNVEEVPSAESEMVLEEILPLTLESDYPVAVVDKDGKVLGMLPKNAIIAALAEQTSVDDEGQEDVAA